MLLNIEATLSQALTLGFCTAILLTHHSQAHTYIKNIYSSFNTRFMVDVEPHVLLKPS